MTDDAEEAARTVYIAVERLARVMRHERQRFATERGLSPLQVAIVESLDTRSPARMGAIAASLEVSQPTASAAVATLVTKGLVEKVKDGDDRRALALGLTEAGRRVATDLAATAAPPPGGSGRRGELAAGLLEEMRALHASGRMSANHSCFTCTFVDDDDQGRRCALLKIALPDELLRADCPEHVPAAETGGAHTG